MCCLLHAYYIHKCTIVLPTPVVLVAIAKVIVLGDNVVDKILLLFVFLKFLFVGRL